MGVCVCFKGKTKRKAYLNHQLRLLPDPPRGKLFVCSGPCQVSQTFGEVDFVLCIGDDRSDEASHAFAALADPDLLG